MNTTKIPTMSNSRTIVTSFNPRKSPLSASGSTTGIPTTADLYEEGDWVLCLAANNGESSTVACSLSSGEILVYDQERLHVVQTFSQGPPPAYPHNPAAASITSLNFGPEPVLISTDTTGSISLMDLRAGQRTLHVALPSTALCLGLGYDGNLAAVGSTRGKIHFTDFRQPGSLLGTYVDSHTDDVTTTVFADSSLLSGAEDGLVCFFDTTQATEETARRSVCNVGSPIRHVGFCEGPTIYCLTGSETVSLWRANEGNCVRDFGWETRANLSAAAGGRPIDYVVDAHWNAASQSLHLLAGATTGESVLYRLEDVGWQAEGFLSGGHRGVVRAWTPLRRPSTFMTAGEDARLCEWHATAVPVPPPPLATSKRPPTAGGGPQRRQRSKPSTTPY